MLQIFKIFEYSIAIYLCVVFEKTQIAICFFVVLLNDDVVGIAIMVGTQHSRVPTKTQRDY